MTVATPPQLPKDQLMTEPRWRHHDRSSASGWWEPRREGERSNEYLARVLTAMHADELAANARAYHYDDFACPPEIDDGMPQHRLLNDLHRWARASPMVNEARVNEVARAVINGEFDGTVAESEAWAKSPEGQKTFKDLMGPS